MNRVDPKEMAKAKNELGFCGNPDCLEQKLPFCEEHKPLEPTPLPSGTVEYESSGVLYRNELDGIVPMGRDFFSFLNPCHPDSGLRIAYFKETGAIAAACFKCHKPVAAFAVARSTDASLDNKEAVEEKPF